jgi:hypothetical protein
MMVLLAFARVYVDLAEYPHDEIPNSSQNSPLLPSPYRPIHSVSIKQNRTIVRLPDLFIFPDQNELHHPRGNRTGNREGRTG